jgi:hypothetical protein
LIEAEEAEVHEGYVPNKRGAKERKDNLWTYNRG